MSVTDHLCGKFDGTSDTVVCQKLRDPSHQVGHPGNSESHREILILSDAIALHQPSSVPLIPYL